MSLLDVKRRRDIRRQRSQFIAVAVTIGLGVMLFASSYDAYLNLDDSYNSTYDRLHFADISVIGADLSLAEEVRSIDGVARVETRHEADVPFRVDGDVFLGRAVEYPIDRDPEVNRIDVIEGPGFDDTDPTAVVIESHMAEQFELGVGDTFEIAFNGEFREASVAGIAISAEYIWPARSRQEIFPPPGTFGVAFVPEELFADIHGALAAPEVLVGYEESAEVDETDALVLAAAEAAGAGDVVTRAEHPSNETLQLDVSGFQQLAFMFPALFMGAAGLASFVLLTRLVISQRSQIGTMRASGLGREAILRHYLSYGLWLGLVAGVFGLAVGMVLGASITEVYTTQLGIPDTVRSFHPLTPFIGIAFALLAGGLGAYAPARRAFKLSPAEAMRGEIPPRSGRLSLFERILPPLRRLPVRWLMALRGMGRSKRRSFSTMLGVVMALTLVMVSWGMLDSMSWLLDRQFNEVAVEDANVVMAVPATEAAASDVGDVDGVIHTEVVSTLDATVRFGADSYKTSISAYSQGSRVHEFPDGLPSEGILAGGPLADELGVEVGDTLTIGLSTLDEEFTAELVGFLEEPMGTFLYVDTAFLESQMIQPDVLLAPGSAVVKTLFGPDVDREAVIDEIGNLESVAGVLDARQLVDLVDDLSAFFNVFIGMMLVFGGAMAFSLMYNTISVNVAERVGEFANMRANGLSHGGIARVIAFENLLMTAMGAIPGVIIGYLAGAYFLAAYSSDSFTLQFKMAPASIVISVVAMLATAGLSLIPALRNIRRIDIGTVVRERAA